MSMIISMLLFVIYLYITLLISLINQSNQTQKLVEFMYDDIETKREEYTVELLGGLQSYYYQEQDELYPFSIQWNRFDEDCVDSIRRWQLATNIIS
jgi:hypothetical protein